MPTFVENSNCRGVRPSGIVGAKHNLRPDLTARLLNDRHCARYVIAPDGYGKSSLAYEYAQLIFEFKHVFWIRCDSPCFIRDLDNGCFFESIVACDPDVQLVVCDDLPYLDADRTQAFGDFMDKVIGAGREILVCCVPSKDAAASLHIDGMQLRSKDLLLSDEEVDIERLKGGTVDDFDSCGFQWRTPSVIWSESGNADVVSGMSQEALPIALQCAMFVILVLGDGTLSDLDRFLRPSFFEDDVAYLESEYPYLGINVNDDSFHAMRLDISEVSKAMGRDIRSLSTGFAVVEGADTVLELADTLVNAGSCERAVELVRTYSREEVRSKWIEKNGWSIAFFPDPLSLLRVIEDCMHKKGRVDADSYTVAAWSAFILEDVETARMFCSKAARALSRNWRSKLAYDLLKMIVDGERVPEEGSRLGGRGIVERQSAASDDDLKTVIDFPLDWAIACDLQSKLIDDEQSFIDSWMSNVRLLDEEDGDLFQSRTLMFSGALFLDRRLKDGIEDEDPAWEAIDRISSFCMEMIGLSGSSHMSWPEYFTLKTVEELSERYPFRFSSIPKVSNISSMRKLNLRLFDQIGKWRTAKEAAIRRKGEFELTHPDPFRKNAMKATELSVLRTATPTLNINLFGGLSCWIGNKNDGTVILSREKAKTLLAVISLNHGREVSRERLVRSLWPDSDFDAANKNLYVVWSYLKRALSVGDSCPYLLRTQNGFQLESRYVTSDLAEYEDLCRALLFGRDDMAMWEEMYERVSSRFSEELLPGISNNSTIQSARKMYRDKLVDGLVSASHRLYDLGETRGAAWYAREAKRRDPSREDVYIALMAAQIASDQRASALDTYFECRKYLSENMGIDPSLKVMELYRSIIEEEHEF